MVFTAAYTRARFRCCVPGLPRLHVRGPKRKRPTLHRPNPVDATVRLIPVTSEKNAITVLKFGKTRLEPHASKVFPVQSRRAEIRATQEFCDPGDLFLSDPDVAGRSAATPAALSALEPQTVLIPLAPLHPFDSPNPPSALGGPEAEREDYTLDRTGSTIRAGSDKHRGSIDVKSA